jgi:hypothetical protein
MHDFCDIGSWADSTKQFTPISYTFYTCKFWVFVSEVERMPREVEQLGIFLTYKVFYAKE